MSSMRQRLLLVAGWAAAAVVASLVSTGAVAVAGGQVTDRPLPPLSASEVAALTEECGPSDRAPCLRQLEGSVVGGMGQALYEHVIMEKGQVMNPSFLDYGFPTFLEMPDIEAIEVETDDPIGPYGAKEAGEGTQLSPAPAIVNAVYDAIGVDFLELPVTPEKILDALEAKRNTEKDR